MRQHWMALVMAPLSACQSSQAKPEPSLPTVSFAYNEDREYAQVLGEADAFCEQEYDKDAVLLSRGPVDGFYEAVFTCR